MRWRAAESGDRFKHLVAPAFDKSLGLDLALQMFRRDLGSKGIYAGIEGDHVSVSLAYDVIRKPAPTLREMRYE
jgi:hypothetical protein